MFGVVGTGREVELGDKGKMVEQGDGRSGTDTEIYGKGSWRAAWQLCDGRLAGELPTLATDQMEMLSQLGKEQDVIINKRERQLCANFDRVNFPP